MKTRNVLLALAAAAAVPAFAFTGTNTCGIVRIDSTNATTVIGVPWVEVSEGATAISVDKLITTNNLAAGDQLLLYKGSTWVEWQFPASGWESMTTAHDVGGVTVDAPASGDATIQRGKALVLKRVTDNRDLTQPFYLYGQYTGAAESQTLNRGTIANPVYTLLASPNAVSLALSSSVISNPCKDDQIIIYNADGSQTIYTRNDSGAWGRYVEGEPFEIPGFGSFPSSVWETATIPAGQGFWYVSRGNATGDLTVNWN